MLRRHICAGSETPLWVWLCPLRSVALFWLYPSRSLSSEVNIRIQASLFRWLMLTIITGPAASYCGAQLIPNGREKQYLVAVLAGASANVALNLFFIPKYGALAAVFTTAFSQGIVALMNYHFVKDLSRPPLLEAVAMSVPATCVMAISLLAVQTRFPVHVLALVTLGALAYLGIYALTVCLWNRISAQDLS